MKRGKRLVHRMELERADLEILLKACTYYGVSLPSYLASAQDDVARIEALVGELSALMEQEGG